MRREFVTVPSSAIPHRYARLGVLYLGTQPSGRGLLFREATVTGKKISGLGSAYSLPARKSGHRKSRSRLSGVTLSKEARAAVEAWAKMQPDQPRLNDAIRRIVQQGLATD